MLGTQSKESSPFFKVQLGSAEYTVEKLGGYHAYKGWTLLQKTMAPVLGKFFDSKGEDELALSPKTTFADILTLVATDFDSPEFDDLVDKMLTNVISEEGEPLNINKTFQGHPEYMMKLVLTALEENFKGFFTESSLYAPLLEKVQVLMSHTVR